MKSTSKKQPDEFPLPPVIEIGDIPANDNVVHNGPYLNLHQRINAVRKMVTYIKKNYSQGMKYAVVSHDEVTAKLRPALVEHGILFYPTSLSYKQEGNRTEAGFNVCFVNVDDPADRISVPTFGYGVDASDKGPGKAVSYGVKMALLKTFNLETGTGEDPDFDQDSVFDPGNSTPPVLPEKLLPNVAKALAIVEPAAKQSVSVNLLGVAFQQALAFIQTISELNDFHMKTKFIFEMEEYADAKAAAWQAFKDRKAQISANEGII